MTTTLIFDLELGGHHTDYIQYLIEYWNKNKPEGYLKIIVPPTFLESYSEVVALTRQCKSQTVMFVPIAWDEYIKLLSMRFQIWRIFAEWRLLNEYVCKLKASYCVLMHFDRYQLPMALHLKSSCLVSGIYFRPALHYHTFLNHESSLGDIMRAWRHRLFLSGALHHPALNRIFCLDPYAVQYIRHHYKTSKILELPDPVKDDKDLQVGNEQLDAELQIEFGRQTFLFFGEFHEYKGIYQLLEAFLLLSPEVCRKICLLFVGRIGLKEQDAIEIYMAQIQQQKPVQIIRRHEFILEKDIQPYFQLADVVLAPYQRFMGMSGIVNRAAVAGKPILTSNYGLLGELTRQYKLGLAVDTTQPAEIARGIQTFVEVPIVSLYDPLAMKQFAQKHSSERFAEILLMDLSTTS